MPAFGSYDPASFGWSYAAGSVPFAYQGVEFPQGVANTDVAVIFRAALDLLVPLMSEPLGVHGDCWGYEPRNVKGSTSQRSFHGYGIAIDVNATTNGQTHAAMSGETTTLPLNTGTLIRPLGAEWGGDWTADTPRDPMHLELHLTPAGAHALAVQLTTKPPPSPAPSGADVSVVMFTRDAKGQPHEPCWFYGDGTRSHPLGQDVWTAVNELHRLGAVTFVPVSATTYNAFPVRTP